MISALTEHAAVLTALLLVAAALLAAAWFGARRAAGPATEHAARAYAAAATALHTARRHLAAATDDVAQWADEVARPRGRHRRIGDARPGVASDADTVEISDLSHLELQP